MTILSQISPKIQIECGTKPGTAEWARHLADLARLEQKSQDLGLYPLPLELAVLILEHRAHEWVERGQPEEDTNAGA
jgi:hypothetical protein